MNESDIQVNESDIQVLVDTIFTIFGEQTIDDLWDDRKQIKAHLEIEGEIHKFLVEHDIEVTPI